MFDSVFQAPKNGSSSPRQLAEQLTLASKGTAFKNILSDGSSVYWLTAMAAKNLNVTRRKVDGGHNVSVRTRSSHPRGLVRLGGKICWFDVDTAGRPASSIERGFSDDAETSTLLETNSQGKITAIASNGSHVFYALAPKSGRPGAIVRISSSGEQKVIVQQVDPEHINVKVRNMDASERALVYIAERTGHHGMRPIAGTQTRILVRVKLDDMSMERISKGDGLAGVAVDNHHVYWTDTQREVIRRAPV